MSTRSLLQKNAMLETIELLLCKQPGKLAMSRKICSSEKELESRVSQEVERERERARWKKWKKHFGKPKEDTEVRRLGRPGNENEIRRKRCCINMFFLPFFACALAKIGSPHAFELRRFRKHVDRSSQGRHLIPEISLLSQRIDIFRCY